MTPPPGLYSGTSTLALNLGGFLVCHLFRMDQVARASAFGLGLIYGNVKLKALKIKKNSQIKAEAKAHH
ncbi:hypothetical protein YC2023_063516 [Brassica napus]